MFGITDLVTYVIGSIIVIVLPGPNSLYSLSVSASYGVRRGYYAVAGIFLGDSILILLTVLGVGTLLKIYPTLFIAMKMIGVLYLVYLGLKLLIKAYETYQNRALASLSKEIARTTVLAVRDKSTNQSFLRKGMLLSLTNPKGILFFLSFFVQFVDPTYSKPLVSFLVLAIILQVLSLCYQSLMVLSGKRLAMRFHQYPWLVVLSMGLVGLLFIGFAVSLWLAQLR